VFLTLVLDMGRLDKTRVNKAYIEYLYLSKLFLRKLKNRICWILQRINLEKNETALFKFKYNVFKHCNKNLDHIMMFKKTNLNIVRRKYVFYQRPPETDYEHIIINATSIVVLLFLIGTYETGLFICEKYFLDLINYN
jgi:hypothetical protein